MANPSAKTSADVSDDHMNQNGLSDVPSDVTIASAVAVAVRGVPAVIDLSPGRFALAATYGSRQRVTGVVVYHPSPHELGLEVHVVINTASSNIALANLSTAEESGGTVGGGLLPGIATQIRDIVCRTLQDMGLPVPRGVDVFIDDID